MTSTPYHEIASLLVGGWGSDDKKIAVAVAAARVEAVPVAPDVTERAVTAMCAS